MKNITAYRINGKPAVTEESLRRHAFQGIDSERTAAASTGFVSYDDYLDSDFKAPIDVAHFTRFALRMDTRKVQPAVMRKHLRIALDAEKAATGKQFISRDRKQEIREQVHLRLMAHTEPKPEYWPVVIDNTAGLLFFGCTQEKVRLLVEVLACELLGANPKALDRLTPMSLDQDGPEDASEFLTTLLARGIPGVPVNGKPYLVAIRDKALAFDQDLLISAATINGGEVGDAFRGRHVVVRKGRVVIEGDEFLSMTVDSMLSISGLKIPKITPDKEDPDGEFLERMHLTGLAVGALHKAFKLWCAKAKAA
jgi:hypothetical protein